MAQTELVLPHRLTLNERESLSVTGVSEVVGFDESAVQLNTTQGTLWVHGSGLKLKNLDPEGGCLTVSGAVSALVYEQTQSRRGWLSRLLG